MTGSSADAEDLVQEAFVRAIERPPADVDAAWRPWLVRVAMNLCRDALRRRKRRRYPGFWLPTPVETEERLADEHGTPSDNSPEARYGLMESASFAFLVALEALTPSQRAVLLLRDAFDYSSEETAEALEMSEGNVRITLHRARKAMADYDESRAPSKRDRSAEVDAMLSRMLMCMARRDLDEARRIFSDDAVAIGDGGGVYHAARKRIVGPDRIVNLYNDLSMRASPDAHFEIRSLNGQPAIVGMDPNPKKPNSPRWVVIIDLDRDGLVRRMYSVIAPQKLAALRWPAGVRI
jgi:RNA polymerase sigma-70 factor (ECF subfamily)